MESNVEESTMEEGGNNTEMEVAPALVGVHPSHRYVTVAVGSELRVFDVQVGCAVSLVDDSGGPSHKDSIRAICYGANGKLFASAGDDKLVKIWNTDTWHCICNVSSEKRVSAISIRNDGRFVCFADKFGVVWAVDLDGFHENHSSVDKKAVPILAHYCSIITNLKFSPDGRFIVSADRDFKIRVTVFPEKPLDGAHEIQSFCLGHTEFISCLAFVSTPDYPQGFLVSGSGDSTVCLWDIISGSLLDSCEVGTKVGLLEPNGKENECHPAITDLCVNSNGSLVAVAVQSLSGIVFLSCNVSVKRISFAQVVSIVGETFIPTSLGTSFSTELLWMVTGVSSLHSSASASVSASLARVRVVSGFSKTNPNSLAHGAVVLEDKQIPGGEQLLEKLQGGLSIDKEACFRAAEMLKTAMHNLLIKKQYSVEKREFRKRGRNDKKIKE